MEQDTEKAGSSRGMLKDASTLQGAEQSESRLQRILEGAARELTKGRLAKAKRSE